ncbi:MAG: hypothetical protein LBR90_01660 [Elusimicrobiota bacterium]|jgi:putative peptidoglycan lipid II flippase|nr:hypothetical protein [Elusimicrobiota bacterium]
MATGYKRGAIYSVGFAAGGKLFSLASGLLVAFYFGAGAKTDIYFYLILTAALLNGWLQNVNTSVVVPEFMHLRQKNAYQAAGFANFFLYIYAAAAAALTAVCFLWPARVLGAISSFTAADIAQNLALAALGAAYFGAFFVMTFLVSITESYKHFKIYFLSPLNTLLALLALLIFKSLEAMFAGYILAYLIHIAACLIILAVKDGWHFKPLWPRADKKFAQNFWYMQPNAAAWAALLGAPLFMLSAAAAGIVSALNYARTLADGLLDIFVSRVNNVAKVKITAQSAAQNPREAAQSLLRADKVLTFILAPVCVFTAFFAPDIAQMFFMRGGFSAQDAQNTAAFLRPLILAVPLISLHNNLNNFYAALRLIKEVAPRYFVFALIFIAVFIFAIGRYGAFAYAKVFLVMYAALTLLNFFTLKKFAPYAAYGRHLLYIAKLLTLSAACALAAKYAFGFYQGNVFVKILINGAFFVCLNGLALFVSGDVKNLRRAVWK